MKKLAVCLALAAALSVPTPALGFCGFYVSGADAKLFNNATMVVMMREGTRTVLSMQNNYQGPTEDFAMVVPVPVVLQKENVKTLPASIFDRVDQLASPRLVEYWEQDPCFMPREEEGRMYAKKAGRGAPRPAPASAADLGVKIEAQFEVGEYEIVILSARDSSGLDTWLKQNKYKIPENAEPVLRPYVDQGMKFFVAKVNAKKVRFEDGRAVLSPLRFHYDTPEFSLPVRLGLLNSGGKQDLIVHILAKGQRYEVANYENVTIPTNLDVAEAARDQFGEFYTSLFSRVMEKNPHAVVTEYSWDASSCDPCPTPALSPGEVMTLGADVLPSTEKEEDSLAPPVPTPPGVRRAPRQRPSFRRWAMRGFVLTRLHARYSKESLGKDLVFRAAPPIAGGRERMSTGGQLEEGSQSSSVNNFQARYAIRHPWTGPITCANPVRGRWGGPPGDTETRPTPQSATDLGFKPRKAVQLASFLQKDLGELGVKAAAPAPAQAPVPTPPLPETEPAKKKSKSGCGACRVEPVDASTSWLGALCALGGMLGLLSRRSRRAR